MSRDASSKERVVQGTYRQGTFVRGHIGRGQIDIAPSKYWPAEISKLGCCVRASRTGPEKSPLIYLTLEDLWAGFAIVTQNKFIYVHCTEYR